MGSPDGDAPPPRLRDGQLAWLVVRAQFAKNDRRSAAGITRRFFARVRRRAMIREQVAAMRLRTAGRSGLPDIQIGDLNLAAAESPRMANLSIAVDEVARRLSDGERVALRRDGALPEWFVPEVRKIARTL
jgi:hypothetical protein